MRKLYIFSILSIALLTACVQQSVPYIENNVALPISICSVYPTSGAQTRADDNGFTADDCVGIFIVDYNQDGSSNELAMNNVRAANAMFQYNGDSWKEPYQLFWADSSTPADFYGYYPYDSKFEQPRAYEFTINPQQNSEDSNTTSGAGYEQSDLLWAKAEKVTPTAETINLRYKHLMAGLTISLEKGTGFTDEEWNTLNKNVLIGNTKLSGQVDLQSGTVTTYDNNIGTIKPLQYKGAWRAVVMPQTIAAGSELIIINVAGQSYKLVKDVDVTYHSGKMHNFTISVNKRQETGDYQFKLISDDIVAWLEDPEFHDGLVREYLIVHISEPGKLGETIVNMGYKPEAIGALKITGELNHDDLIFIGEKLTGMTALNIKDIRIVGNEGEQDCLAHIGNRHFNGNQGTLSHIILPTSIKRLAYGCLQNLGLVGSIDIPEGVTEIDGAAFAGNYLSGELKLPSSLKAIGGSAFAGNKGIRGNLYLPDGLETIYAGAFSDTSLTGPIILPSNLEMYEEIGFTGTTGSIVLPPKVKYVPERAFSHSGCTKVVFHDGIEEIQAEAFVLSELCGELVLPPNLKRLGSVAFSSTKISKVVFPESLRIMDDGIYDFQGVFSYCNHLTGVVELPVNVSRIPMGCFYACGNITGIVIPENIEVIDIKAFWGCSSISSIVSKATTPPVLGEEAFYAVNKDNFTVEVPVGCVNAYKQAPGWREFKRIAEYSNFVCRPAKMCALNTPHQQTMILNADSEWVVENCPQWITLSQTSGKGKTELTLTFKQMEIGAGNRSETIIFASADGKHKAECEVSQYDYQYGEDECLALHNHTIGDGIDIVFVGDGFDAASIADGSYLNLIKEQVDYFFGIEPYKSHKDYFNVYVTFPLSQECGVNTMHTYVDNRFGTLYGYDGGIWTYDTLITSVDEVLDYAVENTPTTKDRLHQTLVILVPNETAYDGNTLFVGDASLAICPPSSRPYPQDTRGVIQHEAGGHAFAKLADESIIYLEWANPYLRSDIDNYHNRGWYMNIASSSKFNSVPWAEFIFDPRYSDMVDIYEGGLGYMRGVFRSELNSCMNYGIPYYNAISRLEIVKRIFKYANQPFTMDYFYANDSFEWGDVDGQTRTGVANSYFTGSAYAESNTHVAPAIYDAKRCGDAVRKIRAKLLNDKNKQ